MAADNKHWYHHRDLSDGIHHSKYAKPGQPGYEHKLDAIMKKLGVTSEALFAAEDDSDKCLEEKKAEMQGLMISPKREARTGPCPAPYEFSGEENPR